MAAKRRVNYLSQQRVDVPDMRAVESAVSNDFDELISSFVTGPNAGYVLRGFDIAMAGAIGGSASGLLLNVDGGAVFHGASSQSGTFYLVPSGTPAQQLNSATNTIVDGAFAPSAINYISIEYERFIDSTTKAQVYLWNPTTNNETTKDAPRASILRYRIKITTSIPPANYLPIATVTTDSGNNVVRIGNARSRLFSQGTGGFSPDPFNQFTWSQGRDAGPTFSTSNSVNPFQGGDQALGSLKQWMDAVTTNIQEIKGTPYWSSLSTSGSLESIRTDLGNTIITGRGDIAHSDVTPGLINWSDDIFIRVIGSRLAYKLNANVSSTDITLDDDQVAYVNLVRGVVVVPNLIFTNNSKIISSVGAISWTGPLQSGDWVKLGSDTDSGYYQIDTVDSLTQVTLLENYGGASTGPSGAKAKYAFGSYSTSSSPSTSRDIYIADRNEVPAGENIFWLMARSDNSGAVPRVYIRFLGMELEEGETEQISDNTPLQLLQYIGSPIESATKPNYASAINPGAVAEVNDVQVPAASSITSNQYFLISSSADARKYYVWFNKDGTGVDPQPQAEWIPVEVTISTGQTAPQVATQLATALSNTLVEDFTAIRRSTPNTDKVRVTNNSGGNCTHPSNFNVSGLTITNITDGSGDGNYVVNDADSLTVAIKKLDSVYGALISSLDDPSYDEPLDIASPVAVNDIIDLPDNTRLSNITQYYTVGKGSLQIYLNGQYLTLGVDWLEVGSTGVASNSIQIKQALVVGDVLEFRISSGGAGSGGGGIGPQGPAGVQGPPGQDALGGPISVNTYIADYTVLTSNKIIKADCSVNSQNITFTLPPAASATGVALWFKKIDNTAFQVFIQADGSELIDGLNIQALTVYNEGFMLVSDGTTWSIH